LKYTKQILEQAVKESKSFLDVLRHLQCNKSGGTWQHIKKRIRDYQIDTSHFLNKSQIAKLAQRAKGIKPVAEILTTNKIIRERTNWLRRALLEIGREYKCEECSLSTIWNNKKLVLQIDHINGDWSDCRAENLRFLCPNCHSQTSNFRRNKS
jgi:hypothetical protein